MLHLAQKTDYDVVVVGARASGAATALLLSRGGARVLLVDRDPRIEDTLSTHALMRPAVELLAAWGCLEQATRGAEAVNVTTFTYGTERIAIPVKPKPGMPGLYAPRRTVLDNTLIDAARSAGATVALGQSCDALLRNADGRVTGVRLMSRDGTTLDVTAGLVVGADGRASTVARMVRAETRAASTDASATAYTYVAGLPNEGYRWYYGEDTAAGLIPTGEGLHCLFTSCRPSEFRHRFGADAFHGATQILSAWEPGIAEQLKSQGPAEKMRRFLGAPGHIKAAHGPGWALVGDAGYFKDPASAHGISDALMDADRLARAYLSCPGDLSPYEVERDHHALPLFRATQEMAALKWDFPRLQQLHQTLSLCMKEESAGIEARQAPVARAA